MTYGSDLQVNIPPELRDPTKRRRVSFQGYLSRVRNENPMGLYLNQLADYYYEQTFSKKMTIEEAKAEYDKYEKEAQGLDAFGYPVNTFPLYAQVSQLSGPNIMQSYEDWSDELEDTISQLKRGAGTPKGRQELDLAIQEGVLSEKEAYEDNPAYLEYTSKVRQAARKQEQSEAEQIAAQKQQLRRSAGSEIGQIDIQEAIARGEITEEDVYQNNPYYQRWAAQQAEKMTAESQQEFSARQKQARALQDPQTKKAQNWIDYQAALAANPETAGQAELGFNEQRARDLVEEERRATTPGNIQGAPAFDNLEGILQMVQSQGIDTSAYQNELKTLSQRAQAGQANQEMVNAAVLQMVQRINQDATGRQRTQNQFESELLAKQFPDAYAGWKNKPENSNAYFSQWAKNDTPFQQLKRAQEETNLRKYGDIYDAYSDFTGGLKSADEYKPIDQWIQETPRAKIAWEERQRRQMLKDASLPLPPVRYVRNR